ncbi:hypothetical protein Vadar_004494 [Vaccinium darrowii]|uniref:Uncharacterized protein n=1 Tax=Vaccinium darrowii TaxID=229202 RepID=A0ACB7ZAE2_9ERIC|nr:hypothetical protein Vadar_004494 [Vaccinium darrowii]
MSCLLPQFKCLPETFSFHPKTHFHPTIQLLKCKESIYFRAQCLLSTASPPTSTATATAIDVEKLLLRYLDDKPNPAAADRPWTYVGTVGPPTEVNFGASLATETILTSEEATIAAASAEAVALAKSAVRVAKEAAMMVSHKSSITAGGKAAVVTSESNTVSEIRRVGVAGDLKTAATELWGNFPLQYPIIKEDDFFSISEELKLLPPEFPDVAVRSRRQSERKTRRAKAAEETVANSVNFGSTSRKRRTYSQDTSLTDPLRYLRGITSGSRLLTAAEEHKMSEGIQDLLKLEKLREQLAEHCGGQPTFAQWADAAGVDQKILNKRLKYGTQCKNKMIKSNIRLVVSIAKNFSGAGMDIQDLVLEGCKGLVKSVEKFDASKGFKFSTYAHWWIKQAVRKSLNEQTRTIRLPSHIVESAYKVKAASKELYCDTGRKPNKEQVAEATGLSMKRIEAVLLAPKNPISLDQKTGLNQDLNPLDVISDPDEESPEDLLIKQLMLKDLEKVLDTLRWNEKIVIRMRFGLGDGRMRTLQEIGEALGVSRERIRQIEMCALRKLRSKRRAKHLQQYASTCAH